MIRADPASITLGRPLTQAVFTAQGALLAASGARIIDPQKVEILRWQGWCQTDGDADESQESAPKAPVLPLDAPPRVPLGEAAALVADDMPLARSLLTRILTEQGIKRVTSVEDGKQAITRYFIETPHLVFLDIDMPKLDGLSALEQIKGWTPDAFVCLVSANSTQVNVRAALQYRVDAFLVKPYTILNMQRVLARYQTPQKDPTQ